MARKDELLLRTSFLCGIVTGALIATSGSSYGKTIHPNSGTKLPNYNKIETVVVTAQRRSQNMETVPVAVSNISARELAAMNITRPDQLSEIIPNLSIAQGSDTIGGNAAFIRGIGEQEPLLTMDSPVGTYLDGVYLGSQVANNFDVASLARIEVMRGPQGTLFGRNTIGGAINYVTRNPSSRFTVEEDVHYGSFGKWSSRTVVNTGQIANTGLAAIISYEHSGGGGFVKNLDGGASPGDKTLDAIWAKVRGKYNKLTVTGSFDYHYIRGVGLPWFTNFIYSNNGLGGDPLAYYSLSPTYGGDPLVISQGLKKQTYLQSNVDPQNMVDLGTSIVMKYEVSKALTLKSITAYRQFSEDERSGYYEGNLKGPVVFFPPPNYAPQIETAPVSPFFSPSDMNWQHQYSEELQAIGRIHNVDYTAGFFYFNEHVEEKGNEYFTIVLPGQFFGSSLPNVGSDLTQTIWYTENVVSYAGYGQVSYRPEYFNKKLQITGGLRYTADDKSLYQPSIPIGYPVSNPATFYSNPPIIYGPVRSASNVFSNASWLASLSYQWTRDIMTYLRISTGFTSGGYDPRAGVGLTGKTLPFMFRPEHANAYEIGLKSKLLHSHLQLNGALYYTKFRNLQESQFSGAQGYVPQVDAHYQGFELEANIIPFDGLLLTESVGYVDPVYDRFEVMPGLNLAGSAKFNYVPNWTLHSGIEYVFEPTDYGEWSARVDYSYASRRYFMASSYCTAAICLNPANAIISDPGTPMLSARIQLDRIPFGGNVLGEIGVYGSNLLNYNQRTTGIDFGPALGVAGDSYGPPRTFGVELDVKY